MIVALRGRIRTLEESLAHQLRLTALERERARLAEERCALWQRLAAWPTRGRIGTAGHA